MNLLRLAALLWPIQSIASWIVHSNLLQQSRYKYHRNGGGDGTTTTVFVGNSVVSDNDENNTSNNKLPTPTPSPPPHDTPRPAVVVRNAAQEIYSMPALYDLAFGFRNYDDEVEFLLNKHKDIAGFPAQRILDIGAGPGRHGIAALQRRRQSRQEQEHQPTFVTCVDASPEMAAYAQQLAMHELSIEQQRSNFHYVIGDFRDFDLSINNGSNGVETNVEKEEDGKLLWDTAWILLGSLQHLTTNSDVVQCFSCIHKYLRSRGTLILELPHPRETFAMTDCTKNDWTVPLEDDNTVDSGELEIIWGDDDDHFDPITQIRQLTIEMKLSSVDEAATIREKLKNVRGVVPTRLFTAQEIDALANLANFQTVAMFGALEDGVSIDDEDAAFRLIHVLQKK